MILIDTHAHFDGIDDIDAELAAAAQVGVTQVIAVGVDLAANRLSLDVQKRTRALKVSLAFGIHPGNIIPEQLDETLAFTREHHKDLVAIGEIGLDYWYGWMKKNEAKKQEQLKVFQLQLDLAKEFDLPAIVHSRGAWKECFDMVKASGIKRAVFHWYSGPTDVLKDILDSGYFISATPALHYSPPLQEAVRQAPIEQTLIETDSPVVYRLDKENPLKAGPKDVFVTLDAYAQIKGVDKEKAAVILNDNARKLFDL
ncbi:MAG: TatD family hydrolase [Candidatus Omnitrophota bacterium]